MPLATSSPVIFAMSQLFVILFAMVGILALFSLAVLPIIYLCVIAWKAPLRVIRGKYTHYD